MFNRCPVYFSVQIIQGDLVEESIKFAKSVIGKPLQPRRLTFQPVKGADKVVPVFDGRSVENFVPRQRTVVLLIDKYL